MVLSGPLKGLEPEVSHVSHVDERSPVKAGKLRFWWVIPHNLSEDLTPSVTLWGRTTGSLTCGTYTRFCPPSLSL